MNTATTLGNVPAELSSFIGRQSELRQLAGLLAANRLVTLVGPGGVGKSRLATRLATANRERYRDGVWLVDLSTLDRAPLVGQAVADVLQVRRQPGRTWQQTLIEHIDGRALLLVLDNCEHLIAEVAQYAAYLLRCCPALVILASSREPLNVEGELVWRVQPLFLPSTTSTDVTEVLRSEAAQLFIARVTSRMSDFTLTNDNARAVARICDCLGGLPLALELVAARVPHVGLQHLAARLDARHALYLSAGLEAPARQQTLYATIDWSYGLLSEPERILLRRLAIFMGGWTLDAAEATCSDEQLSAGSVAQILDQLVSRSLVLVKRDSNTTRYGLLEITRLYALDLLEASDEHGTMHSQHARYMLAVASSVHPARLDWQHAAHLDQEQDNLRAALRWAIHHANTALARRLAIAAHTFWYLRGRYTEGRAWLTQCLALPDDAEWPKARATVGCLAGHLALCSGDCAGAEELLNDALAGHRMSDNHAGIALATYLLALVALWRGDLPRAHRLCEAGATALRHVDEDGDLTRLLSAALPITSAQVELELGNERRAHDLTREPEVVARAHGDRFWLGRVLHLQARSAAQSGQRAAARVYIDQAVALMHDQGDRVGLVDALCTRGHLQIDQGHVRLGHVDFADAMGIAEQSGERIALISALEGVARALAVNEPAGAVRLASACNELRVALGCSAWPTQKRRLTTWLAQARGVLGPAAYSAARLAGRDAGQAEAVELARQLAPGSWGTQTITGSPLTHREDQVAVLLAQGLSNKHIAARLTVSVGTVRSHVDHILLKLGLHSRAQVAVWANHRHTGQSLA